MRLQNKKNTKEEMKLGLEHVCGYETRSKSSHLPSSKISLIIIFFLHKIRLKICLMILFYNYRIFVFLYQIIKHISLFPNNIIFYSCLSSRYIVSKFCSNLRIDCNWFHNYCERYRRRFSWIISSKYICFIFEGFCIGILIYERISL